MGTTYFVIHNGPQGTGTGLSVANGMAGQAAIDTANVPGDEIRICQTGTYAETAQWDFDTNTPTQAAPIHVKGYDATGTTEQLVTVNWASTDGIYVTKPWYIFKNISAVKTGAAGNRPWQFDTGSGQCMMLSSKGINGQYNLYAENAKFLRCIGCDFSGASTGNIYWGAGNVGATLDFCGIHDGAADGVICASAEIALLRCFIYDNADEGIEQTGTPAATNPAIIDNCVIDGNGGDGILLISGASASWRITNNSITRNGGYGVNANAAVNILAYGNAWPASDDGANTSGSTNNITVIGADLKANLTSGDVLYTSVVDGSEDYHPQWGSILLNAGYPDGNIGVYQAQPVEPTTTAAATTTAEATTTPTPTTTAAATTTAVVTTEAATTTVAATTTALATTTPTPTTTAVATTTAGATTTASATTTTPCYGLLDPSNVRLGIDRGDGVPGNIVVPLAAELIVGAGAGSNGTEVLGNVVLPAVGNVLQLITYGPAGALTGTLVCSGAWAPPAGVPILEIIAQFLKHQLDTLVLSGRATRATRPLAYGLQYTPIHGEVILLQGDGTMSEGPVGYKSWTQPFQVDAYIKPSDLDTTPVDTAINTLKADIEAILRSDPTCGGYAQDLEIQSPEAFMLGEGYEGLHVQFIVHYRTLEDDPYAMA